MLFPSASRRSKFFACTVIPSSLLWVNFKKFFKGGAHYKCSAQTTITSKCTNIIVYRKSLFCESSVNVILTLNLGIDCSTTKVGILLTEDSQYIECRLLLEPSIELLKYFGLKYNA